MLGKNPPGRIVIVGCIDSVYVRCVFAAIRVAGAHQLVRPIVELLPFRPFMSSQPPFQHGGLSCHLSRTRASHCKQRLAGNPGCCASAIGGGGCATHACRSKQVLVVLEPSHTRQQDRHTEQDSPIRAMPQIRTGTESQVCASRLAFGMLRACARPRSDVAIAHKVCG